ncbi:MAG: hypothetical protein KGJ13_08100 [Patescibacteria group bacterium]|nr:hypothetical protein [Patescibacteria group bacterium]
MKTREARRLANRAETIDEMIAAKVEIQRAARSAATRAFELRHLGAQCVQQRRLEESLYAVADELSERIEWSYMSSL